MIRSSFAFALTNASLYLVLYSFSDSLNFADGFTQLIIFAAFGLTNALVFLLLRRGPAYHFPTIEAEINQLSHEDREDLFMALYLSEKAFRKATGANRRPPETLRLPLGWMRYVRKRLRLPKISERPFKTALRDLSYHPEAGEEMELKARFPEIFRDLECRESLLRATAPYVWNARQGALWNINRNLAYFTLLTGLTIMLVLNLVSKLVFDTLLIWPGLLALIIALTAPVYEYDKTARTNRIAIHISICLTSTLALMSTYYAIGLIPWAQIWGFAFVLWFFAIYGAMEIQHRFKRNLLEMLKLEPEPVRAS